MKYEDVRKEAQEKANKTGCDFGLEKNAFGYTCFMLPRRENRFGHEARCEVVMSEKKNWLPGHGPNR